eukprot:sb/3465224/
MRVVPICPSSDLPSARSGHRIVTAGQSLILFGGYTQRDLSPNEQPRGELKRDLWSFNINSQQWSELKSNPDDYPLATASSAVIALKSKIIVYGGSGPNFGFSNCGQLRILDLTNLEWSVIDVKGDPIDASYGHSISMSPDGSRLYMYGGTTGQMYFNTMHVIDTINWTNTSYLRSPTPGRYRAESIEHNGKIIIFGGGCPFAVEDFGKLPVFCTETNTWSEISSPSSRVPAGRTAHSCTKVGDRVYVIGGEVTLQTTIVLDNDQRIPMPYKDASKEIWVMDLNTYTWSELPQTLPTEIFFHSSSLGTDGNIYVFGGSEYCAWKDQNGYTRRITKRINKLFKLELQIPSLSETAWDVLCDHHSDFDATDFLDLGIPEFLVRRSFEFLETDEDVPMTEVDKPFPSETTVE